MEDIKIKYTELKKKYKLPDYDMLNDEFEISTIEDADFLLREIIRKVLVLWETPIKLLEGLLQPDTASLSDLNEYRSLNENEKAGAYKTYRSLMVLQREATALLLEMDNANIAAFISGLLPEWKKIKKELIVIVRKASDLWKNDSSVKEDLGYLG